MRLSSRQVLWGLGLATIGLILLLVWRPWDGSSPPPGSLPREVALELNKAREMHGAGKWCEAMAAWERLIPRLTGFPPEQAEAQTNLQIAKQECQPDRSPISAKDVDPPPPEDRPELISEDKIAKFYPVGRTVRSIATLDIGGKGINRKWAIEGESHFHYQYFVEVETRVIENRGTAVVFVQDFKQVTQVLGYSRTEIQVREPGPILALVWDQAEQRLLNKIPFYVETREIVQILDPKLKRSLTFMHDQLKKMGWQLDASDDVALIARLDKLSGQRVQLTYVSGLGVTHIDVLDGEKLDEDDLERLAYNSSLFMDYFVSENDSLAEGQTKDVDVKNVGGLLNFGYDVELAGKIELRKEKADKEQEKRRFRLAVTGGEVHMNARQEGADQSATLTPESGTVVYSPDDLLVREADMSWSTETAWLSNDHLLFGTERIRDITIRSHYDAERQDIDAAAKQEE